MLLVTSNKFRQLLYVRYVGQVRPKEFQRGREDLVAQLGELPAGFRLLADFSQLESMKLDCEPELGRIMEMIGRAGVALVVREKWLLEGVGLAATALSVLALASISLGAVWQKRHCARVSSDVVCSARSCARSSRQASRLRQSRSRQSQGSCWLMP